MPQSNPHNYISKFGNIKSEGTLSEHYFTAILLKIFLQIKKYVDFSYYMWMSLDPQQIPKLLKEYKHIAQVTYEFIIYRANKSSIVTIDDIIKIYLKETAKIMSSITFKAPTKAEDIHRIYQEKLRNEFTFPLAL